MNNPQPDYNPSKKEAFEFDDMTIRRGFIRKTYMILTSQLLFTIAIICIFIFVNPVKKYVHRNVWTFFESVLLGTISGRYSTNIVLMAMGVTTFDFTGWACVLIIITLALIIFGIFAIIFQSKVLNILYSVIGAILFSFWLIYDTQMMLGGKHKYSLSPEEYIFAALNLYVDVIQLFLFIMGMMGKE
ncbi:hypothetical protein A3Q56_03737 [Intoshia linei]|uniref:Uncharacterized protein n=1 Tax=Intoshia linei TaxID=1819745 RepID=A0A177B434_9BILA|nr:hypothetical protein A3Q56_03737 [Intoshia linei]